MLIADTLCDNKSYRNASTSSADTMQGAYVVTVAGILRVVPFSDLDLRWELADCDSCGSKTAEERDKAEAIG
jgi:hypothetical protein